MDRKDKPKRDYERDYKKFESELQSSAEGANNNNDFGDLRFSPDYETSENEIPRKALEAFKNLLAVKK